MKSHKDLGALKQNMTLHKRFLKLDEVANTAVFFVSDAAGAIAGNTINVTCGSVVD